MQKRFLLGVGLGLVDIKYRQVSINTMEVYDKSPQR